MAKRPTPATAAGSDRESALNSILAFIDSLDVAVVVVRGKGRRATVKIPRKPPARDQDARCRDDVLAVLRDAGQRLTTSQIEDEFATRHVEDRTRWFWAQRTIKGCLAEMVEAGELDNDPDAKPRGYGIVPVN